MILLDTHIWIQWIIAGDGGIPAIVRAIQEAEAVAISALSCWEVVLLSQRRRIELPSDPDAWKQYMQAYEACLSATSTTIAPWYVVLADNKKNARLIISRIILDQRQP